MEEKALKGYFVKKVGNNRGNPRVWLEGMQAERGGFTAGTRYDVTVEGQTVVLSVNKDGSRIVSGKQKGERTNPIIDINSKELLAIFDGMAAIRVAVKDGQIYLLPLASELKKQERFQRLRTKLENGEPLTTGSLSHGGGILTHALHSGLAKAGIKSELVFANEIREDLLEHARLHNDAWSEQTVPYAAPMQELAFDARGVASLPKVDIVELGLPCSAASVAGISKRGLDKPEAHPLVGHLVVPALCILNKVNAAVVIFENVVNYSRTASADILRNQLRDMGYSTHERILSGKEWKAFEGRDRWCMIAVTHGLEFDFDQLMPPDLPDKKLGEVLESISDDDPRWSRMQGLKDKEVRDLSAGKGFRMQTFTEEDASIGTITRGYSKIRSTDPKILNSNNPDLLRQLTPLEHSRIKEVPAHLVEGLCATTAHEVLGQGVLYRPFQDVGQHVGNALRNFVGLEEVPLPNRPAISGAELVPEATAAMADEILGTLVLANSEKGHYLGAVVVADDGVLIQDTGRGVGVVHQFDLFQGGAPKLGASVEVKYELGKAKVSKANEVGRSGRGVGVSA